MRPSLITLAASSHVTPPSTPKPFLHFTYQPSPTPINALSYGSTRLIATERDHPLHIRTQRRLAQFQPGIFSWTVHVPQELNKKAIVRSWAKRRVREAFAAELRAGGWDRKGAVVAGEGKKGREVLRGVLVMRAHKDGAEELLRASGEEVRGQCRAILGRVAGQVRRHWGKATERRERRMAGIVPEECLVKGEEV